ncbi:MAG: hypothetical protein WAL63_05650 [Solirubrobacteraceae bacterium]
MALPTSITSLGASLRLRAALLAIAGLLAWSVLAPATTSARQTLVHAFIARDGSTVVSGYDGGVAVAPAKP